jgi:hypothetical protein
LNYLQDGWIVGRLTSSKIYDLLWNFKYIEIK